MDEQLNETDPELLPCPFCGEEAEEMHEEPYVGCSGCLVGILPQVWNSRFKAGLPEDGRDALLGRALDALSLCERWLVNCVPVVDIDGPTPLPVLRGVVAEIEKALSAKEASVLPLGSGRRRMSRRRIPTT